MQHPFTGCYQKNSCIEILIPLTLYTDCLRRKKMQSEVFTKLYYSVIIYVCMYVCDGNEENTYRNEFKKDCLPPIF